MSYIQLWFYGMAPWVKCKHEIPPDERVVVTKIEGVTGPFRLMKMRRTRDGWFPENSDTRTNVFPTHWRYDN